MPQGVIRADGAQIRVVVDREIEQAVKLVAQAIEQSKPRSFHQRSERPQLIEQALRLYLPTVTNDPAVLALLAEFDQKKSAADTPQRRKPKSRGKNHDDSNSNQKPKGGATASGSPELSVSP